MDSGCPRLAEGGYLAETRPSPEGRYGSVGKADQNGATNQVGKAILNEMAGGRVRKKVSKEVEAGVLTGALRRCCICFALGGDAEVKQGQIAHLDHDRTNSAPDNLAFLCLAHHDQYDSRPSQSKGLSMVEVKSYRATLVNAVQERVIHQPPSRSARPPAKGAAERELGRALRLRDRMHKDFLKPPDELARLRGEYHPYKRLRHPKIIVREIGDQTYGKPYVAPKDPNKLSGWFRVEPYNFYHNGLEVILGIGQGLMDSDGGWAPVDRQDRVKAPFREVRLWCLGQIPWRNIRRYDAKGDEYYAEPHLFCLFADDGSPYESYAYSLHGEQSDWRLDEAKRLSGAILQEAVEKHSR